MQRRPAEAGDVTHISAYTGMLQPLSHNQQQQLTTTTLVNSLESTEQQ